MEKVALLSVSDRTGVVEFARVLHRKGYTLLATSGTAKLLTEQGIPSTAIEEYTKQPEILSGRVKTLHPRIHGGLLADLQNPEHERQLREQGIPPIEIAVINLYPFLQGVKGAAASELKKMVELIDIGGPTMIRAAAKNFRSVLPVIDPQDYAELSAWVETHGTVRDLPEAKRFSYARKVFLQIAEYDLAIATYFGQVITEEQGSLKPQPDNAFGTIAGSVLVREQSLRYGENPHQKAAFYRELGKGGRSWTQLQGKELSYNNLLDFDAALRLIRACDGKRPAAAIIKHLNPCGVAYGESLVQALQKAKRSDPRSHFGGILAFNGTVTRAVAEEIREDFAELVVAPAIDADARAVLEKSKNLRVLTYDAQAVVATTELRSVEGGVLLQEVDRGVSSIREATVVSKRRPTTSEEADLQFAWLIAMAVRSNAIAIAKDEHILAVGGGQMSRIDSVEVALHKCRTHQHATVGAVAASDAFFPFPDSIETLAAAGIRAIIAPSGAKRDADAIAAADAHGVALLFASDRHFKH